MTPEGFLEAPALVAKTGIYEYLAYEIGLDSRDGLPPNQLVRVYRPPEEVFSSETLDSYNAVDITNEHPQGSLVESHNYKKVVVGTVTSSGRKVSNDGVEATLLFKDPSVIAQVQSGKVEVSPGYKCHYIKEAGVTPTGDKYDYVQRGVEINHVALVGKARGGKEARVADSALKTKGRHSVRVITTIDGATVVINEDNAAEVERDHVALKKEVEQLKKAKTADSAAQQSQNEKLEAALADKEKLQGTCDAQAAQIEKLETATTDSVIAERVKQVSAVKQQAEFIAKAEEKEFTTDSVSIAQIQRECLAQVGLATAESLADKADAYVSGMFDLEHSRATRTADAEKKRKEKTAAEYAALSDGKSELDSPSPTGDSAIKTPVMSRHQQYALERNKGVANV